VLIDTCIWIDFLRGSSTDHTKLLEKLLEEGEAYLCGTIFCEICFGAENERQFRLYHQKFSPLPFLEIPPKLHIELARMGFLLRKKGYHPYIADLTIAQTALFHEIPILTNDRDFIPYQKIFGLKLA
jgi:predicted nucleic acid-binding protein